MDMTAFARIAPTTYAEVVTRDRVMDHAIHPLWQPMPRIAGPAYPVACPAGDKNWAMAGGNVCAWAQKRGVAGFVVDRLIRDIGETRAKKFLVFGRGVIPIPGVRKTPGLIDVPVVCGGVTVVPGDIVVADEEGVVVLPAAQAEALRVKAQARADKEETTSLEDWVKAHKERVDEAVRALNL